MDLSSIQPHLSSLGYREGVYSDLCTFTRTFPMFFISFDPFHGQTLARASGMIDIPARMAIGISIWIPKEFPFSSPIIYIHIPANHQCNPNSFIDQNGLYRSASLAQWGTGGGQMQGEQTLGSAVREVYSFLVHSFPFSPMGIHSPMGNHSQMGNHSPLYSNAHTESNPQFGAFQQQPSLQQQQQQAIANQKLILKTKIKQKFSELASEKTKSLKNSIDQCAKSISETTTAIKKLSTEKIDNENLLIQLQSQQKELEAKLQDTKSLASKAKAEIPSKETSPNSLANPASQSMMQVMLIQAEYDALNDLLFSLESSFHVNCTPLEEYLKNIRSLAKDQFWLLAALKQKIRTR